jgi:hypothetical protein
LPRVRRRCLVDGMGDIVLAGLCFTAEEWRELDEPTRAELLVAASGPVRAPSEHALADAA